MSMIWLFVLLLAVTAFLNLAEMALVAVRGPELAAVEDDRAARALSLKQRPGLFLAAIRAGDLLTDLLTGAFVVTALDEVLTHALTGVPILGTMRGAIGSIGAFAIVSFVVLVFGDLAPKSIALGAPVRSALAVATPLRLFIAVAQPFFLLLEWSNAVVLRLFGMKPGHEAGVTQAEIRRTLAEGLSSGVLLGTERSMMERVLDLERRSVRTVMTGRRSLQTLRENAPEAAIREAALGMTASRLVLLSDATEPVGVGNRADILAALARGRVDLPALSAPVHYVVESASVLSVLGVLKDGDAGLAVVVDEFGTMLGIVTFADVLEAIAGDIAAADPVDVVDSACAFTPAPDGSFIVSGTQPIDDLIDALRLSTPAHRSFKTVAGLVIERARRLPQPGETFAFDGFDIEVTEVEAGAVVSLRVIPADAGSQGGNP